MLSRLLKRLEVDSAGFLPLSLRPIWCIDQSLLAAVDLRSDFPLTQKQPRHLQVALSHSIQPLDGIVDELLLLFWREGRNLGDIIDLL